MLHSSRPWRFFIVAGFVAVVACGVALRLLIDDQEDLHTVETAQQLLVKARMLRDVVVRHGPPPYDGPVSDLVQTLREDDVCVVLMTPGGEVVLHAAGPDEPVQDLVSMPEFRTAANAPEAWGSDVRPWGREQRPYVIVALRAEFSDKNALVIWLACPRWTIAAHPDTLARLVGAVGVVAAAATLMMVALYLRLRKRVLSHVIQAARNLSAGNLAEDVTLSRDDDEFGALASSLRAVRRQLLAHVELIDRQRRMLQSLVDQLQEGVIAARADGRIALVNPAASRLLGLGLDTAAKERWLDQPVERLIPQHPLQCLLTGAETYEPRPILSMAGMDEVGTFARPGEVQLEVDRGGDTTHILARASDVILADPGQRTGDALPGRVVLLTDITDVQRMIQARTDFVANASHELRTPLATIRAAVETLLSMDLAAELPAARTFLEKIDRHSARLEMMVRDLLDLSRLETPTEHFDAEAVDLGKYAHDLQARFAERVERKRLHWTLTTSPPEARLIHVNPHLLRMSLDNVIDNAIKFTEPQGHVAIAIDVQPQQVTCTVRDDGCGIPAEEQPRVFERFYQVKRARSGPERGTGLGLSIVRHAIAAMRGTVSLESEPGAGTTVTLRFPQVAP